MSETNKAKFLSTGFQLESEGHTFDLKGLASDSGITKVQVVSRPPPHIDEVFGKKVTVHLGRLSLKATIVRHYAESGSFFEIRFEDVQESQKAFLRQLTESEGVHPGWARKYPRIPVKDSGETGLPVVNLCLMRFLGHEYFVPVVNFSLGGVRIEIEGEDVLKEVRVGKVVHFDLLTNSGDVLPSFTGEVRNITVKETLENGTKVVSKSFGISFQPIKGTLRDRFYELIRGFCQELIKQIKGES
ncbi:MAG TPA: PilZ domain-containing protein [Bdellovibrionota bacterium]|jgi:hypothetical protein